MGAIASRSLCPTAWNGGLQRGSTSRSSHRSITLKTRSRYGKGQTLLLAFEGPIPVEKLKISIFVLVHQNKDSTGRADRRPTTTDIKFAGGGVAFDILFFPYTAIGNDIEGELNIETSLEITKNRGGGMTGTIPLIFAKNILKGVVQVD